MWKASRVLAAVAAKAPSSSTSSSTKTSKRTSNRGTAAATNTAGGNSTSAGAGGVMQFSGSYLDRSWAHRFILGTLLQRYDPPLAAPPSPSSSGSSSSPGSSSASHVDVALMDTQRLLSEAWALPVKPLDAISNDRILRLLARYACGEGTLSDEALEEINAALAHLPGAPRHVEHPANMEKLLEAIQYVTPGDNIRRIAYRGQLHYAPQAESAMLPFLRDELQHDGGDAFDAIRVRYSKETPAYAIDSATTSEVDDAISVHVDPSTGEEYFCVHVSDATVYCPFDSQLELLTARALATTTYLPEDVFFMLPKPIVEAATLRDDRPCRTFTIRFQFDEATYNVKNYSVQVGWLEQLRRITYDQVQELLVPTSCATSPDDNASTAEADMRKPPTWLTPTDEKRIARIHEVAKQRLAARLARSAEAKEKSTKTQDGVGEDGIIHGGAVEVSLPDPLVKVSGTHVLSVTDQVLSTQDARLTVAELMIAANEVCARVAQTNGIPIPHRGTRSLSGDHEAALYYEEPQGVLQPSSLDSTHLFMAEAMQRTIRRLSGVTRAIYYHTPLYHAGLDTTHYAHSTSPLRRYADMLVHHQLKLWLWRQHGRGMSHVGSSTSRTSSGASPLMLAQDIPEYSMATLCTMISGRQEQASLLQDSSIRFWILRYVADRLEERKAVCRSGGAAPAEGGGLYYWCLVGETRCVRAAPEYRRSALPAEDAFAALMSRSTDDVLALSGPAGGSTTSSNMESIQKQRSRSNYAYVSDIYIPELQLAHTVCHPRGDVVVGALVKCRVTRVMPTQGVLEMEVTEVTEGADERDYKRLLSGSAVSSLDA